MCRIRHIGLILALAASLSCDASVRPLDINFGSMVVNVDGMPLEVASGFGCHYGSADGSLVFERAIEAVGRAGAGYEESVCMITDVIQWSGNRSFGHMGQLLDACARDEVQCEIVERYAFELPPPLGMSSMCLIRGGEQLCQELIREFLDRYRTLIAEQTASRGGVLADGLGEQTAVRVVARLLPCNPDELFDGDLSPIPDERPSTFVTVAGCAASEPRALSGLVGDTLLLDDIPFGLDPDLWCSECQVCACTMGQAWCLENGAGSGRDFRPFCTQP